MKTKFEPVVGLEVHVELKTSSKMFCPCSANYFGQKPNTHVCPVCLGLPGSLPVANKKAIELVIMTGLALGSKIPLFSKFDRKNYFYPDLPKGFQISQYDLPLAQGGELTIKGKKIGITRVHLEEDTAKLVHLKGTTLIDFNRSGVPLMEIVSEPDLRSAEEVQAYAKKIRQTLRYLGVSDCDMEKGQMRFELNVSLREKGKKIPNYKVEVKNINSFRFLDASLKDEVKRQSGLLMKGEMPVQETRGFDEAKGKTVSQRWKEEAQDYRYFPEPDLPPMRWTKEEVEAIRKQLPELPEAKQARFQKEYRLTPEQVRILTTSRSKADYFEEAVKVGKKHGLEAKKITNVIINKRLDIDKLLPAELITLLIKKKAAPKLSSKEIKKMIKQVIKDNPRPVTDYRAGKKTAIEFLVGQVMKMTKGGADPKQVRELIRQALVSNG